LSADPVKFAYNDVKFANVMGMSDNIDRHLPKSDEFGLNTVAVFVAPEVKISAPDDASGFYSLNDEGGHFLYWAANSSAYYLYLEKLKDEKRNTNGGHNADDKSGQMAEKLRKEKNPKVE
jgi:hypothetical protein